MPDDLHPHRPAPADPAARSENLVHPSALVDPKVEMGTGNVIGAYAVLHAPLRLGNDNWVGAHAVLGSPPEIRGFAHTGGHSPAGPAAWSAAPTTGAGVVIGAGNVLREHVTVQSGSVEATSIGDRCFLMTASYAAHDVELEDEVTLAARVLLAGHVWIGRGATMGMGTVVHQRVGVGAGAMVGMGSAVTRPIPPWSLSVGSPCRVRGANLHRLRTAAVPPDQAEALHAAYRDSGAPATPPGALADDFRSYAARLTRR